MALPVTRFPGAMAWLETYEFYRDRGTRFCRPLDWADQSATITRSMLRKQESMKSKEEPMKKPMKVVIQQTPNGGHVVRSEYGYMSLRWEYCMFTTGYAFPSYDLAKAFAEGHGATVVDSLEPPKLLSSLDLNVEILHADDGSGCIKYLTHHLINPSCDHFEDGLIKGIEGDAILRLQILK